MFSGKKIPNLFLWVILCVTLSILLLSMTGWTASIDDTIRNLDSAVKKTPNLPQTMDGTKLDVPKFIGMAIKRVLEVTGAIFFAYLIYGAFLWMLSEGESKRIERAKDVIFWAVVGIIIILLSYAITSFVFTIFT